MKEAKGMLEKSSLLVDCGMDAEAREIKSYNQGGLVMVLVDLLRGICSAKSKGVVT